MPTLANKSDCTGCTSCISVCPTKCIQMIENEYGFFYPEVDNEKCIGCMQCTRSCPICSNISSSQSKIEAFAAFSNNNELREKSSSGGIFSEVASIILNQDGAVFGAAYDDKYRVHHICIETLDELYKLRGAKYAQSNLQDIFPKIKDYLLKDRYVLFVGTPCQVVGLKNFLKEDYSHLFCIDFICHGVSSPLIWEKYVQYRSLLDNNGKLPLTINMRSKKSGWSHYEYSNEFIYDKCSWNCKSKNSLYMKLFVGDYINRLSCSNCHVKGYNRLSDITLGDFWGIWNIFPEMDDNKGTSVVLLHSQKAKNLFSSIRDKVTYKPVTLDQVSYMNKSILESSMPNQEREKYMQIAIKGDFDKLEEKFSEVSPVSTSILRRLLSKFSKIIR